MAPATAGAIGLGFAAGIAVAFLVVGLRGRARRRPSPVSPPGARAAVPPAPARPVSDRESIAQSEREIGAVWLQFLRREVADTVNALNTRFTVIKTLLAGLPADGLDQAQRDALERIGVEVDRALGVTASLHRQVSSAAPAPARPSVSAARPHDVRPSVIVLLEPDEATREVIGQLFTSRGHTVIPAADGVQAFAALQERAVDCVVSETRVPRLSGPALYAQVEERLPHLARRFVFVSGDTQETDVRAFLERAGRPVIPKPFDAALLIEAVEDVLEQVAREAAAGGTTRT